MKFNIDNDKPITVSTIILMIGYSLILLSSIVLFMEFISWNFSAEALRFFGGSLFILFIGVYLHSKDEK